MIKVRLKMRER